MICLSQTGHHASSKCMSMVVGDGKWGRMWGFKGSSDKEERARFDVELLCGNGHKVKRNKGEHSRATLDENGRNIQWRARLYPTS